MIIYVASPYSGDRERNEAYLRRALTCVLDRGHVPIAPHAYLPTVLDDNKPHERALALHCGLELLNGCDEVWAFVDYGVSAGMSGELSHAWELGKTVVKKSIGGSCE